MDFTFFLDRHLTVPLYQQLYQLFREEMHHGRILKGTKLPSKRKLAVQLAISQTTVEQAYEQLAVEGYIMSRPRSGWFADYDDSDCISVQVESVPPIRPEIGQEQPTIDFHYGNVDSAHFPYSAWRRSMVHSLDQYGTELYQAGDAAGEYVLRELIAGYLYRARGVRCLPKQIILGAGSPILIQILCQLFGTSVAVGYEDPGSARSRTLFELNHMNIIPIPVDSEGMSMEELQQKKPGLVYVTPSHQFPSGTIMTINRRRQLLKWAAVQQSFIIEDDYDGEFRYSGQPIPSLQGLDQHNRVIYMGTFSKSLLPSLRISYMVLPESLLQRGQELTTLYKQTVSCHTQLTLVEFIQKGEWQKHINRMRKLYQRKRAILLEHLHSELGDKVNIRGDNSGLHILLDVHSPLDENELIRKAKIYGVKVYPVSPFYIHSPPSKTILIGFAGVSADHIEEGIQKLRLAWEL